MSTQPVPPRHVPVVPVMRRPSPVDPLPGTWAVIGVGDHGAAVLAGLGRGGVPALGYDRREPAPDVESAETVRWGHEVIAIDEIEDIEALAVTSRDVVTHEITTEYFAGVAIGAGAYGDWPFIDPDLLNVVDGRPVLAHRMFTPRHPAVIVSGPDVAVGLERQADVIAAYAASLRTRPREALSFHRRACARLLPGYPRVRTDPVAGEDYDTVLDRDLETLHA